MLRTQALADLFNQNLDATVNGIFVITTSGYLAGSSSIPPSNALPAITPSLMKKTCILSALTWRHHLSTLGGSTRVHSNGLESNMGTSYGTNATATATDPSTLNSSESDQEGDENHSLETPTQSTPHSQGATQPLPVLYRQPYTISSRPDPKSTLKGLALEIRDSLLSPLIPLSGNLTQPTRTAIRECAIENVGQGLLVCILGPEIALPIPKSPSPSLPSASEDGEAPSHSDQDNENPTKASESQSQNNENIDPNPSHGSDWHGTDGGTTLTGAKSAENEGLHAWTKIFNDPEEAMLERKRRVRTLAVKAEAMAEFLRGELSGFKMPRGIE